MNDIESIPRLPEKVLIQITNSEYVVLRSELILSCRVMDKVTVGGIDNTAKVTALKKKNVLSSVPAGLKRDGID